jgi:hypothetical protein
MTIRSIDMQVLIQKVNDVGKMQNIQQQEGASRQQENINQINQQTNTNTNSVNQSLRSESSLIHEKQKKEKKSKKKAQKKGDIEITKNNKNNKESVNDKAQNGSKIDIII